MNTNQLRRRQQTKQLREKLAEAEHRLVLCERHLHNKMAMQWCPQCNDYCDIQSHVRQHEVWIEKLKQITDSPDFGEAPSDLAIQRTHEFLEVAWKSAAPVFNVLPSVVGGVLVTLADKTTVNPEKIDWPDHARKVCVEFWNNEAVVVMFANHEVGEIWAMKVIASENACRAICGLAKIYLK